MMAYKRISPQPVVEGGTGIQSATVYAPICGGTSTTGAFQSAATGIGTSGFVLTSTGASSLPTWQAGGGGGGNGSFILLNTQTITGTAASISFGSSLITSTYQVYFLLINNLTNGTSGAVLQMDWSTNNGSTYLNSGYFSGCNAFNPSIGTFTNTNSTATNLLTEPLAASFASTNGYVYLNFPLATYFPTANGTLITNYSTSGKQFIAGSGQGSALLINNIRLSYSTGVINQTAGSAATVSLYGIKQ